MDIDEFSKYGVKVQPKTGGPYFFQDNGGSVLGIAHLDSVQTTKFGCYVPHPAGSLFYSPKLDDRLGVYTMLYQLPRAGLVFDVLLTTGEESGNSSGKHFVPPEGKNYNWMFQFDRTGDDVVMYMYRDEALVKILEKSDFRTAYGSASDISRMEHLGIKGFNVGCGYHDYHQEYAFALIDKHYLPQVKKFQGFFADRKNQKMKYTPAPPVEYNYGKYNHRFHGGHEEERGKSGTYPRNTRTLLTDYKKLGTSNNVPDKEWFEDNPLDLPVLTYNTALKIFTKVEDVPEVKKSIVPVNKDIVLVDKGTSQWSGWTKDGFNCPKCGRHCNENDVRNTDGLNCYHCGINIMPYLHDDTFAVT